MKNNIAKVRQIFRTTSFTPTKLIKGPPDFATVFKITRHNYQKDYDSRTVLYEGLFQGKNTIIKIYLHPEKEIVRFERELYIYTKIKKQAPIWKKITANLWYHGHRPLPFLILEKLVGSPLGDWFHINHNQTQPLTKLLTILPLVYQQTKLPKKYAYNTYDKLEFFLKKTEKMTRTLAFLEKKLADYFWRSYLNLGRYLEKRWFTIPTGFIFSDLNPANIFLLKKGGFRIIDFDAVSLGKKTYDYAFLYYASIGNDQQKFLYEKISNHCLRSEEKDFFLFFFAYFSLTHSWSFMANRDLVKFNAVVKELKKLFINSKLSP